MDYPTNPTKSLYTESMSLRLTRRIDQLMKMGVAEIFLFPCCLVQSTQASKKPLIKASSLNSCTASDDGLMV